MFRKQILENAIRTVCQDRRDKYGQIEDNFGLIADELGCSNAAVYENLIQMRAENEESEETEKEESET